MSVETQIRSALLASTALSALIGNRLYAVTIDQGTAFPCAAMQRISTQRIYSHDQLANPRWGKNGWARFQFTIFGDGASGAEQARTVAEALINALKTFNQGADPACPEVLTGAPNFVVNQWESVQPNTTPPKFMQFVDAKIFIREEN